jgi:hypothetical protein
VREVLLYPPVRDWLVAQGYTVWVEIFDCDIVGMKDGLLVAVELKPCFTAGLSRQCDDRCKWADFVLAAVASRAKCPRYLAQRGVGVLEVRDGRVIERKRPRRQPWWWQARHAYRIKRLATEPCAQADDVAGVPSGRRWRDEARKELELLRGKDGEV